MGFRPLNTIVTPNIYVKSAVQRASLWARYRNYLALSRKIGTFNGGTI